jgi:hypothetical protein
MVSEDRDVLGRECLACYCILDVVETARGGTKDQARQVLDICVVRLKRARKLHF